MARTEVKQNKGHINFFCQSFAQLCNHFSAAESRALDDSLDKLEDAGGDLLEAIDDTGVDFDMDGAEDDLEVYHSFMTLIEQS